MPNSRLKPHGKGRSGQTSQSPIRVSYQGEPGANSHIACREVYPGAAPLPCATFEDAFAAIKDGSAALGMIPIENSIAGRVADIHHFLPASGLHIVGEYFLPIHFQLLTVKGGSLATIKSVYSHGHALGQCRKIIRKLGLKPSITGDPAGSARDRDFRRVRLRSWPRRSPSAS